MLRATTWLFAILIGLWLTAQGEESQASQGKPPVDTHSSVYRAIKHDVSKTLREMEAETSHTAVEEPDEEAQPDLRSEESKRERVRAEIAPDIGGPVVDEALQRVYKRATPITAPALGLSFEGIANGNGWSVADPNLAVGDTQVVEWVNTRFAVYDKNTGSILYGPVNGNTLWSGFGGACETNNNGDPIVQYDKAAGRWVMMQHATPSGGPYSMCLAVSTTSDAKGTFNRYSFQLSTVFTDYPKLGVWPDGYYVSFDYINGGAAVCALDRNAMLTGANATSVCFNTPVTYAHLLPSDLDGRTQPPAGAPNYFMNLGTNSLNIWQFHVDFVNPNNSTFSGPTNIGVAAFSQACGGGACIPQLGTTQQLDSVADRLMYRLAYRRFSDGHEALVVTHSVGTPSGIRWYEIRSPGSSPSVFQRGTYSPNSNYRWMGSIAMDAVGDIAMGYSESSSTMHPAIAYTGRLSTGTKGTMQSENILITGGGSQLVGNFRWDDYTSLSVDPVDDCTFWHVNQYYKSDSIKTWNTRIASFKFSGCSNNLVSLSSSSLTFGNQTVGTSSTAQSVTLTNGQTIALNVTSIAASGDFTQTNNCGTQLAAGASCTISVTFTPTTTGTRTGALTVTDDAGNSPQTASLTGTGVNAVLSISPTSLNFGNQILNSTSSSQTVTLTNSSTTNITINSVAISGNYTKNDTCSGVVLTASQSCTVGVTFTPTVIAAVPGALTITDTATGSPHVVPLNGTGILAVTITSSLSFASQTVGTTSVPQVVTLTNQQNSTLSFSWASSGDFTATAGGSTPCGATLAANAHCTISVTFTPQTNGLIKGALWVTHGAVGSPAITALSGTGSGGGTAPLTFTPTTVSIGNVALGLSGSQSVTIKNSGSTTVNLTSITASATFTVAPSGTTPCGSSLAAGKSCTETVTFTPVLTGAVTGAMNVFNDGGFNPQVLNLSATGVNPVSLSPTSISFGSVTVGTTSAVQVITVTNNENVAIPITGITASGQFISTTGGSLPCGANVPANSICTLGVQFSPVVTGALSGALTFNYSANASPQVVGLSGTGQ